jgi:hypothetical protein
VLKKLHEVFLRFVIFLLSLYNVLFLNYVNESLNKLNMSVEVTKINSC